MVASPSQKTAFWLIHTPHRARLPTRLRALGHFLAIRLRFFFELVRTRPGTGQVEWRGLGQAGTGVCIK
jgi:hypothetical protein